MLTSYDVVKVFDLSIAPAELREADDLASLRPASPDDGAAILSLRVGQFSSRMDGPINDCTTREVTLTEYKLHRWLTEQGAEEGEDILLRWKGGADW